MDLLDLIDSRRSTPARQLGEPGPTPAQIERLLGAAIRVPDHGKLTPWRLVTITGDMRIAPASMEARESTSNELRSATSPSERPRSSREPASTMPSRSGGTMSRVALVTTPVSVAGGGK